MATIWGFQEKKFSFFKRKKKLWKIQNVKVFPVITEQKFHKLISAIDLKLNYQS